MYGMVFGGSSHNELPFETYVVKIALYVSLISLSVFQLWSQSVILPWLKMVLAPTEKYTKRGKKKRL